MLIYSVFTRPDTSANFWLESEDHEKFARKLGFHLNESVPHLVLETTVQISDDGLTYTQIRRFPDNDAYITYRKTWLRLFTNIIETRKEYLYNNNHTLEMFWKHNDLTYGGEIIEGIPQL